MFLVLDTESSGLFRPGLPVTDPAQPHIVQLAALLFSPKWRVEGKLVCLIKPESWSIEPEAEAVHGISEQRAHRYGISIARALVTFADLVTKAQILVAHNADFDRRMVDSALAKIGAEGGWWRKKVGALFCTMEASTDACALPGLFGYKFPTLEEAHNHYYPERDFRSTHDAEADVMAAAEIYRAIKGERNGDRLDGVSQLAG